MKHLFFVCAYFLSICSVYAQTTIRGSVIDNDNQEPLVGAAVMVYNHDGTSTGEGTVCDIEGKFSVITKVNSGSIKVQFIGYTTKIVEFSGDQSLKIDLEPDAIGLDDVMVIGYGKVKKKDLSTAVSSLQGIEEMKSRSTGITGMLQGNVSGVTVMNNGGDPTASASIVIRGKGSPSDSPLWVVDGVPGAPVRTEDIETLTVLKDAASAAIYGANVGSGGVIVVTTKKAKAGKIRVNANYYHAFLNATNLPSALNAEEFNAVKNLASDNAGMPRNDAFDSTKNPDGAVTRTNWIDQIFRPGKKDYLGITLSGGTDRLKALTSFEGYNSEGTLLNTFKKGMSGKMTIDYKLSDRISISEWVQAGVSQGYSNDTQSGYTGAIISAIYMPPSATVFDTEGNYGGIVFPKNIAFAGAYGDIVNPVATLERKDLYNPNYYVHSSTRLDIEVIKDLTFRSIFTMRGGQDLSQSFDPKRTEIGKPVEQNSRSLSSSFSQSWLWENTLTYNKKLGRHDMTLLGGYSSSYEKTNAFGLTAYDFDYEDEYARHLSNATNWSKSKPWEEFSEMSSVSSFARLSYGYADRYFLTGSIRNDATSKLFIDNNKGTFPAISAAWKLSSEKFFNSSVINLLKFRGSWGQIGNVNSVPNYATSVSLASSTSTLIGKTTQELPSLGRNSVANLALTWETSEQTDIGLDLSIFDSKVEIIGDYYVKYTKDLIDRIPMSSTAGVISQPYGNIGKVKNEGYELSLSFGDSKKDFSYRVGANISYSENTVEDLGSREMYSSDISVRGVLTPVYNAVEQPWNSFYLIQSDGLFQTDQEAKSYVDANGDRIQPDAQAGDLKFIDKNGDGIINDNDREFMGSAVPKITYGFTTSMNYKGVDFSMQLQGVDKAKVFNAFKSTTLTASEQGYNMSSEILTAWSESNTNSSIPRISSVDPNKNFQTTSDWFLEDASYLRLKNITLGYTLSKTLMSTMNAPNLKLRLYVSGDNLFTITDYSGIDPEVGNNGVDVGKYPIARTYSMGVNVSF